MDTGFMNRILKHIGCRITHGSKLIEITWSLSQTGLNFINKMGGF